MDLLPKELSFKHGGSQGQALLIVLLLMAVVLAVVIYRVSSTVSDIQISSTDEDAGRAFAAAEAGIEKALLTNTTVGSAGSPVSVGTGEDESEYYVEIDNPTTLGRFATPPLKRGEEYVVWMTEVDSEGMPTCAGGNCFNGRYFNRICFGSGSGYTGGTGVNPDPAIVLTFYVDDAFISGSPSWLTTDSFENIKTVTIPIDPISSRAADNNFLTAADLDDNFTSPPGPADCTLNNISFKYRIWQEDFIKYVQSSYVGGFNSNGFQSSDRFKEGYAIIMTVKVLYTADGSEEVVGFEKVASGADKLPHQGNFFVSTGESGDSTRKIKVFKSLRNPLDIFLSNAMFSFNNIAK